MSILNKTKEDKNMPIYDRKMDGIELVDFLQEILIGHRIVSIDFSDDSLILENGTELRITPNEGCGGCSNGWAELGDVSELIHEAAVMNVECKTRIGEYSYDAFSIFVYYTDKRTVELEGSDGYGNGYYGGGFWVDAVIK